MSTCGARVHWLTSASRLRAIPKKELNIAGLLAALLLTAPLTANAALDPAKALTQYTQKSFGIDTGLPHNSVTAITQTRDGYLWIGTEEGLARFDGVRFTVFDKENTPALRSNQISALAADSADTLWIATAGGGLTSLSRGHFQSFTTRDGLSSDTLLSLYPDKEGALWIGTDGQGLNRLRNGQIRKYGARDGLPDETVFAVSGEKDGTYLDGHSRRAHQLCERKVHYLYQERLA